MGGIAIARDRMVEAETMAEMLRTTERGITVTIAVTIAEVGRWTVVEEAIVATTSQEAIVVTTSHVAKIEVVAAVTRIAVTTEGLSIATIVINRTGVKDTLRSRYLEAGSTNLEAGSTNEEGIKVMVMVMVMVGIGSNLIANEVLGV